MAFKLLVRMPDRFALIKESPIALLTRVNQSLPEHFLPFELGARHHSFLVEKHTLAESVIPADHLEYFN